MSRYILLSPAKLNLYLKVINKRKDGYHNINSVVQKISLFDIIYLEIEKNNLEIEEIKFNTNIPKNNTVKKAIKLFKKATNINFGYRIYIEKRIPSESGLGGGSSNAATILKFLNNYFKINFSLLDLINIGKKIGADVPLFIENSPLLLMYGIGDKIKILKNFSSPYRWFILIKPEISLSTKKVYEQLKLVLTKSHKSIMEDSLFEIGFNDLEKVAFKLYPELKDIKYFLKKFTDFSLMTGSGSVIFAGFKEKVTLEKSLKEIKKFYNNRYKIYICRNL